MVPDYSLLYQDSHRERPSRERQEFHDVTFLKIWNSNQESSIPSSNMRIEHQKGTNQRRVSDQARQI